MKCDKQMMRLYAVTDRAWTGKQSLYEQVEAALKGGATCVQLREKALSDEEFLAEALEIRELCGRYHVPFFINDNVEIAIRCKADGIHVGQEDMAAAQVRRRVGPDMMIGVSAHSVEEALEAVKHGADCLGVGAMFSTSTKTDVNLLPKKPCGPSAKRWMFRWSPSAASTKTIFLCWQAQAWMALLWSVPFSRLMTLRLRAGSFGSCQRTW